MNFRNYQKTLRAKGSTEGQVRKNESDIIMEATWDRDIQSRKCYIYDYYHDDDKDHADDLSYTKETTKTPIDAKFIITEYGSLSKDQVAYHVQFKPSQKCALPYFQEQYQKYGTGYPIGMYIDIPDDEGVYHKWMICTKEIGNSFVKYNVLPCNYHFHWVYDNKRYAMWGVARLRMSYNSGLWTDHIFTAPENQDQMWLPLNDISVNFYYDQRIIISVQEMDKPITWKVSKVENIHPIGINKITLSQTKFNPETDRKVDGFWYADYALRGVEPKPEPFIESHESIYSKITFSGKNPVIKIHGGEKKFTASFYNEEGAAVEAIPHWSYYIEGKDVSSDIYTREDGSFVYIKVTDESFIGKILTIKVQDEKEQAQSEIKAELTAL